MNLVWILSLGLVNSDGARDSVWYALPKGFDQSRPDEILKLVPQAPLYFDAIYLFGDSDCDTGNLFQLSNQTDPDPKAYWKGRFSNGPMWPDYLQAKHQLEVRNYAYGGAVVNRKNGIVLDVPDFFEQFEIHSKAPKVEGKVSLGVIQFVGNDLINLAVRPNDVVRDIGDLIQKLIDLGEIKHF
ncbi:hypothetical protein L0F63_006186 [Massospora cicadina]|nr:hypothetical protein L0F63_006186 [Massospora cicadina]